MNTCNLTLKISLPSQDPANQVAILFHGSSKQQNITICDFFFRISNYKLHVFLAFDSYEAEVKRQFITQYLINVCFTT